MKNLISITLKKIFFFAFLTIILSIIAFFTYSHMFLRSEEVTQLTETLENVYLGPAHIERQILAYKASLPIEKGDGFTEVDASYNRESNTITHVLSAEIASVENDMTSLQALIVSEEDGIISITCDDNQSGLFIKDGGTVVQSYIVDPTGEQIYEIRISAENCN